MFDDVDIRYYRESDMFYGAKDYGFKTDRTGTLMYYIPDFIKRVLGVDTKFLTNQICYPYVGQNNIFDKNYLVHNNKNEKDKIVIVGVKNKKVVSIAIFKMYKMFIYLSLFCVERVMRKSGYSSHFIKTAIDIARNNSNKPIILKSTEEGYKFYLKNGFKETRYLNIKHMQNTQRFEYMDGDTNDYIGKYLMIYDDKHSRKPPRKLPRKTSQKTSRKPSRKTSRKTLKPRIRTKYRGSRKKSKRTQST